MELLQIIQRIKHLKSLHYDYQVADLLGIGVKAFSARKKVNSIPLDKLRVFCHRESINPDWLLLGEGEPHTRVLWTSAEGTSSGELEKIEFCQVHPGARPGDSPIFSPPAGKDPGHLFVHRNILEGHLGPFRIVKIKNTSLPPFFACGDLAIVACGEKTIQENHFYAVRTNDALSVNKIHRRDPLLILDPAHHEEPLLSIDLRQHPDPVIGKVIGGLKASPVGGAQDA
ncbi:MAG: hypothetical protein JSU88_10620 [Nitrospinaceae bacterium]|jgi:hypothetical protein|nr:MAG: hypothetical protein JSU88_10620 [Nitrospinaceae bacterium]